MAQGIASNASTALATLWVSAGVTLLFVLLRLYTRVKVLKMYGTDDHYYNVAFLPIHVIVMGLGILNTPNNVNRAILYEIIGQTLLIAGNVCAKLSIGFFLSRLVTRRRHKVAIWAPVIVFGLLVIASTLIFWFSCKPITQLRNRRIDGPCCVDPGPAAVLAGTSGVLVDLWYSGFPWYLLYSINMPTREKITIGLSMSLGVVAAACGTKRAVELSKIGSANYPKDTVTLVVWHAAELSATMIGIGIPTCLPFYKNTVARVFFRGVFGMYTIGGTPYASNGQAALADGNSKPGIKRDEDKVAISSCHLVDRNIRDSEIRGLGDHKV